MAETVRHQPLIDWVRAEMDAREWTISDLARRMNVQPSLVSRWLRVQQPSPETVERFAEAFGASRLELLKLAGHIEDDGASAEAERICALARRIEWTPERYWITVELLERMRRGVPPLPSSASSAQES